MATRLHIREPCITIASIGGVHMGNPGVLRKRAVSLMGLESLAQEAVACRVCFDRHGVRPAVVDLAQPRWVGPRYWTANPRIVILMLNPGAGKSHAENRKLKQLLWRFKEGRAQLSEVFAYQGTDMPNWGWGRFWAFYIEGLELQIDETAFANVAWCATEGDDYPSPMLQECFQRHTSRLLRLLNPDAVLLSGTPTHRFESEVSTAIPNARVVPALHYAHREGREREAQELARLREELKRLGFSGGTSSGPVRHSTPLTTRPRGGPASPQTAKPSSAEFRNASNAAARTAEIARQLGMKSPRRVASGRYLKEPTGTKQINVVVFHRGGFDCIGLEGTGKKRQWVINNDARWRSLGFRPHQPRPKSHKSVSTYIQEFAPLPDGKVDPRLRQVYRKILSLFEQDTA